MTLKLNGSTSGSVSIDAPASTAGGADRTLTLPDDSGNGTILTTTSPKTGNIIQVQTGQVTAASTVSLGGAYNWTNLSAFNVQITPTATSSKILISGFFGGEADWEDHGVYFKLVRTVGGSGTDIAVGDADGSRLRVTGVVQPGYHGNDQDSTTAHCTIPNYLDSPSTTNQITYGVHMCADGASKTWYQNRTVGTTDGASYERLASWLTVMEVAG
tara:strand:- start:861 stop:1505 length:645 start_codon:yes stop_codon:yes gene_type:complete